MSTKLTNRVDPSNRSDGRPATNRSLAHGRAAGDRDDASALFDLYARSGDEDIRNRLVMAHAWLAERCARRFRGRGTPVEDLRQVGQVGLIKAVERYDADRGVPFVSYATSTVVGEIKRYFRDATWIVSVPRRSKDMRKRVHDAIDTLSQRNGRAPAVEEIARHTGDDADDVANTIAANAAYRASSLNAHVYVGDGSIGEGAANRAADQPATSEDALDRVMTVDAVGELPDRDRKIVVWRFYEEKTQREIGERLGISQVQVSRLLRAALDQLRQRIGERTRSCNVGRD